MTEEQLNQTYYVYALDTIYGPVHEGSQMVPSISLGNYEDTDLNVNVIVPPVDSIVWDGGLDVNVQMFEKVVKSIYSRHNKNDHVDKRLDTCFLACAGGIYIGRLVEARNCFLQSYDKESIPVKQQDMDRLCQIWIPVWDRWINRGGKPRNFVRTWVKI